MFKAIYKFFHHHYHLRYHNQYVHAKKLFIFDIFLLIASIGILGVGLFFFFWKPGLTDWIDLKFSYAGGHLKSGEKTTLIINYVNRSKYTLRDATLAVHLPVGFVIDRTVSPETVFSNESTFQIDEIKPGANGQREVNGWIWTEPKKDERILAILSYLPENSQRREQKFGEFLLNLPSSILETTIDFDTKTLFSRAVTPINVTLKNTSNDELRGLTLSPSWSGTIKWDNPIEKFDLKANESKQFFGSIEAPENPGNYPLNIMTEIVMNKQQIIQNVFSTQVQVIYPQVAVEVKIPANIKYAEPKMALPLQISWKNKSAYDLKNQRVRIRFTPGIVDIKATARENNLKIENNELILDNSNQTLLADGKPESGGTDNVSLTLLPTFSVGEKENVYLEIFPRFEANLSEQEEQKFTNDGSGTKIILVTEVSLSSEIRYFTADGDQLGRGPLPPHVGETTKYWTFIHLKNTTNALNNARLNIELAPGVTMTGKQSITLGSSLAINNNKAIWSAPEVPANSTVGIYFEVAVVPTVKQIGKKLKLVNSVQFNGVDALTSKQYNLNKGGIDNVLSINDRGSKMSALVE